MEILNSKHATKILSQAVQYMKYKDWNSKVGNQKAQSICDDFHNGLFGSKDGMYVQISLAIEHFERLHIIQDKDYIEIMDFKNNTMEKKNLDEEFKAIKWRYIDECPYCNGRGCEKCDFKGYAIKVVGNIINVKPPMEEQITKLRDKISSMSLEYANMKSTNNEAGAKLLFDIRELIKVYKAIK